MQLKLSEGALGGWKAPVGGNFSVHNFFIFWILNNVGDGKFYKFVKLVIQSYYYL